jgi:hypothetical protein
MWNQIVIQNAFQVDVALNVDVQSATLFYSGIIGTGEFGKFMFRLKLGDLLTNYPSLCQIVRCISRPTWGIASFSHQTTQTSIPGRNGPEIVFSVAVLSVGLTPISSWETLTNVTHFISFLRIFWDAQSMQIRGDIWTHFPAISDCLV